MSTEAVISRDATVLVETEIRQTRSSPRTVAASLLSCDLAGSTRFHTSTLADPAINWVSPKVLEANRQVFRLACARKFAESLDESDDDVASIGSCIAMLHHLAVAPVPVPVASWTINQGASLFFNSENFYGDLEVEGDQVEYLLRWSDGKNDLEVFDTEPVEEGRVPPRLLAHLFRAFARHDDPLL